MGPSQGFQPASAFWTPSILHFKDTFYADLAGARINELKKGALRAPPNPSDTERLERIKNTDCYRHFDEFS